MLRYVNHLKDRRQRLKKIALDNLPDVEVERLGLGGEAVLDASATQVVQLLEQRGVQIPSALIVGGPGKRVGKNVRSIYETINDLSVADIFY